MKVVRIRPLARLLIALLLLSACAQPPTNVPATATSKVLTASASPAAESAAIVPGGCGATQVVKGGIPAWLDDAGAHNNPTRLPYAVATPAVAAGFIFGYPLTAPHPEGRNNKILWVVALPRAGSVLTISGHPVGTSVPLVTVTQPADSSPGEIYPTIVDVPAPGCWHFDLRWADHEASVELEYR